MALTAEVRQRLLRPLELLALLFLLQLLRLLHQEPLLHLLLHLRPVVGVASLQLGLGLRGRSAEDSAGGLLGVMLAMVLGVRPLPSTLVASCPSGVVLRMG